MVEIHALAESQIGVVKQTQGNVEVEEGNAQALEQTQGTIVAPEWIQEKLEALERIREKVKLWQCAHRERIKVGEELAFQLWNQN